MKIPFMNLSDGIKMIYTEITDKIHSLIDDTQFVGGKEVASFEENFASFCNTTHAVGCSNGTDAITIGLIALGIKRDDTVLVPVNTFIATAEAVKSIGASVEFIDVDERTYTMDPQKLEEFIEHNKDMNIKAIIPVHLYGQMADMPRIIKIAKKHNLKVIEDAAQAHGAQLHGNKPGYYGDLATFSFYPGKNLGAFGDAGAIVTNDFDTYKHCKMLVNHGRWESKYEHFKEGYNNRLDTIQAGVLNIKLKHLVEWTRIRCEKVDMYLHKLQKNKQIILPFIASGADHVWHLLVIQVPHRDMVKQKMHDAGISTGIHYPIPLHLQPAYHYKKYKKGDFKIAEILAQNILSLPLWPEITENQIDYVCNTLNDLLPS